MKIVRNVLAVILGLVIGNVANWGVLTVGHLILPPPEGFDGSSIERLVATIHLLRPIDYTVPFLAHALGPLVGVLVAMYIAASARKTIAIILGALFLLGGIAANVMIPAPMWYRAVDLLLAYIPTAYLGWRLGPKS